LLGRIIKLHGFEGEVTVGTENPVSDKLKGLKVVSLEIEGKQVPFFLESLKITGDKTLIMKFEGFNKSSDIEELRNCRVFASASWLKPRKKPFEPEDLKGFKIVSLKKDFSGTVVEVFGNNENILLKLREVDQTEYLVPFHEDLIISADLEKKVIIMDFPEGLADINI